MGKNRQTAKFTKGKYTHEYLKNKFFKYNYMTCYSYNKKNNKKEFDEIAKYFEPGYSNQNKVQSIEFIFSGTTSGQFLITAIFGRIDEDNKYDRDVFNIFPESATGDTYNVIQSLHFKDESGKRLTSQYSVKNLITDKDKINELYQEFLTGKTTSFSIPDYSKDFEEFIKACHITYKRYLK